MIAGKSEQNYKFAEMILEDSDFSFEYPIIHIDTFDSQCISIAKEKEQIASCIPFREPQSLLGNFAQIRVLTEVHHRETFIGHITVSFDQNRTYLVYHDS